MPLSHTEFEKLQQFFTLLSITVSAAGLAVLGEHDMGPDGLMLLFEACDFEQSKLIDRLLTVPLSLADASSVAVALMRSVRMASAVLCVCVLPTFATRTSGEVSAAVAHSYPLKSAQNIWNGTAASAKATRVDGALA